MITDSKKENNRSQDLDHPPAYPSSSPLVYPLELPPSTLEGIPSEFLIGSSSTPSLIRGSSIVAHLRLLAAFNRLEHSVSAPHEKSDPSNPPGAVRWRIFIHQAVWRFEIWLKRIIKLRGIGAGGLKDKEIPPLDVLLVWHTYLLNPRVYADDTKRVHRELGAIGGLPVARIAAQINPTTLKFEPSPAQAVFWSRMTLAPHEPLSLSLSSTGELAVECPRCAGPPVQVSWLREPRLAPDGHAQGTGWCQNQFNVQCTSCQFKITRESMAVGRFAADIAAVMADVNVVLPGTLFDPRLCTLSEDTAKHLTALLLQPFVNLPQTQQAIGEHLGWSFSGIEASVTEARGTLMGAVRAMRPHTKQETPEKTGLPTRAGSEELGARILEAQKSVGWNVRRTWTLFGPRIAKMLSSYRDNPTPFSMDLVGAIVRQTTFTSKALNLGWLDPSNPNPPVAQSITRYHNFLHLLSQFGRFLVPTLDIDLAWHTHQLAGDTYMSDTKRCVGRYVDHDDKVEEGVLSDGFDTTSRMWESTFHTPYSSCEPLHQTGAITFSKIKKFAKRISSSSDTSDAETGPAPDLTTYPSEHPNTVIVQDSKLTARRLKRERKRAKHRHRGIEEEPFVRTVNAPGGVSANPEAASVVTFGAMGLTGWALLGEVDQSMLNAKTVAKGQCCAGYGMPYYGGPLWVGGGVFAAGGCAAGGCSGGACAAGGCGGGGGGGCGGGGGGCGGGGGGGGCGGGGGS